MKPIVVIGFDMETDIGSWTPFYEGLASGTPRILSGACKTKFIIPAGKTGPGKAA